MNKRYQRVLISLFVLIGLVLTASTGMAQDELFRVAVVSPSATNDLAFTQSMYDALMAIQAERGEENFEVAFSENLFVVDDAAAAIRDYASQGYNLVIAHGSQYGSSLVEIAPDFPDTAFAWGTTRDTFADEGITNVFAYTVDSNEGGYVTGVMAALLTETKVVGLVGPIPAGDGKLTLDGFIKGVEDTDPDVSLLVTYTGSFSDVSLATEAAQTHVDAGADILSGTAQMVVGAIGVAQENDVLWFGHQANQAELAPDIVVASQVYDWTVALDPILENIENGVLGGETYVLTLENGGLQIVFNEGYELSDEVHAAAEETIQGIIDGAIDSSIEEEGAEHEASGEPFRVAAVLPSTRTDYGISRGVYEALVEIQQEYGEENFEFVVSENMFVIDDAAAAVRDYASSGYDAVIAASSAFGSAIEESAIEFPEVSFIWGTTPEVFGLDNVYAFAVDSAQGAYVGGVMAGMLGERVAYVGPIDVGSIAGSADGWAAGALAANPDVELFETFTGSFNDVTLGTEAASTMVENGVTVLASQTEMGVGVAAVAEQSDGAVLFFGNDADFSGFAPESTYASQVFKYGVALEIMFEQIKDGNLGGEIIVLSLDNGGIEVVMNADLLSEEALAAGEAAIEGIIDGSVDTGLEPMDFSD